MLLKVKIKNEIFDEAEVLLTETESCMKKQRKLRTRIPGHVMTFMTAESAFILRESMIAIQSLIQDRKGDERWISDFMP